MPRIIQLLQYQPDVDTVRMPEEPGSDVLIPVIVLTLTGPEGVQYQYRMTEELRDKLVAMLEGRPVVDVVQQVPQFLGRS